MDERNNVGYKGVSTIFLFFEWYFRMLSSTKTWWNDAFISCKQFNVTASRQVNSPMMAVGLMVCTTSSRVFRCGWSWANSSFSWFRWLLPYICIKCLIKMVFYIQSRSYLGDCDREQITFTMRPFESTIQILLAASSLLRPSLAMAMMSRCAIPRAAWHLKKERDNYPTASQSLT